MYIITLLLTFSNGIWLIAQNPNWIISPKSLKFPGPIITPLPTSANGYDGSPALHSSNAIADANDNLLFFTVDDGVYDKDGFEISKLEGEMNVSVMGNNEMCIVPAPGNCQRYFIIGGGSSSYGNGFHARIPYYSILDMSLPNPNDPTRKGDFVWTPDPNTPSVLRNAQSIAAITPIFSTEKNNNCLIAASKLRSDDTRFVFIYDGSNIHRYKIDSYDLYDDNYSINIPYSSLNQEMFRGEMELIELSNGGYRIAFSYYHTGLLQQTGPAVYYADLDQTGTLIQGTQSFILMQDDNQPAKVPVINGLEFSEDGSKLYFTHITTVNYPNAIQYFDFNSPSSGIQVLNVANSNDFQYSQIELAKDGKMYFVGENPSVQNQANRLGTLSYTNTPSVANWNGSGLTINYQANFDGLYNGKSFTLPDQIDGMDYKEHFFANKECCVMNSFHHASVYTAVASPVSAIWADGQNPFNNASSPILIEKELVIPAGAVVTISNMTFKFAPGAKVIVERGNGSTPGGKLVLSKTTFTVDNSCDPNAMWNGVQVYGYPNQQQGTFGTSMQGWLIIQNDSKIEHALKGAIAVKISTLPTYPYNFNAYDYSYTGGVIQGAKSIFRNNLVDVELRKYINTTYTNKSSFSDCQFITDGPLLNFWLKTQNHVFLNDVRGVGFYGCDFINLHPELFYYTDRTTGIRSMDATFLVKSKCAGNTMPCTTYDNSMFKDLYYGIYATGGNSNYTLESDQSLYINNYYGVYMKGVNNATLTKNTFEVYRSASPNPQVANYGLYMTGCTGYTVQENYFTEFNDPVAIAPGNTHGIIVDNSGELHNEIYKNRFKNINIGGQSQGVNGTLQSGSNNHVYSGLQWKCNVFEKNIFQADMAVTSGRIDYQQGYLLNPFTNSTSNVQKALAGNVFSHSGFNAQNDFATNTNVQEIEYIHHVDFSTTPISYGPVVTPVAAYNALLPIYYNSILACPSKIKKLNPVIGIFILKSKTDSLRSVIATKTGLIDGGNTSGLLQTIASQPNGIVKNALIQASPYLSDEVLLAYLQTSPPSGHVSQVLLFNSPLSDTVLSTFRAMSIPKGIKKMVNLVQHGISPRTNLYSEIGYATSERTLLVNDRIRFFLTDTSVVNPFDSIAMILRDERMHSRKIDLCQALTFIGDSTNSLALRDSLASLIGVDNNIKLIDIYAQLRNSQSSCKAIMTNSGLNTEVYTVATDVSDRYNATHAESLYEFAHDTVNLAVIEQLYMNNNAARGANNSNETSSNLESNGSSMISIYPNPIDEGSPITITLNDINGEFIKNSTVEVYTVSGQHVFSQQLKESDKQIIIQSTVLVEGVYIVKLIGDGNLLETHKLLIRK